MEYRPLIGGIISVLELDSPAFECWDSKHVPPLPSSFHFVNKSKVVLLFTITVSTSVQASKSRTGTGQLKFWGP